MGFAAHFYRLQTRHPFPFTIILPAIFIVLLAVGWTQDDIVEEEVNEIWIRKSGSYYEDKEYADAVRGESSTKGRSGTSNFAAMAVARDGGNLFRADRLEEIRKRMEFVEKETKVEYNGQTFTYDDLCASNDIGIGTTYRAPCFRLSPMDFFQEADWFYDEIDKVTWYKEAYQKLVVAPRLERFGALTEVCLPPNKDAGWCEENGQPNFVNCSCAETYRLRTDPAFAVQMGYPESYANPFGLFSDIGNMENNNRCKICVEKGFDTIIDKLLQGITMMLEVYKAKLQEAIAVEGSNTQKADMEAELAMMETIVPSRASVETFNHYYIARGLYGELGSTSYKTNYERMMNTVDPTTNITLQTVCSLFLQDHCTSSVDLATATNHLLQHADNAFSTTNAAGLPFPFFGGDGDSISLFGGKSPFSGSGIDLSGGKNISPDFPGKPLQGLLGYLKPLAESGDLLDFDSAEYQLLATDPMYVWFKAGVEAAGDVACNNDPIPGTSANTLLDSKSAAMLAQISPKWCTPYNELSPGSTRQDVAMMWYDLLIDSESFLGVQQGSTTPYSWTTGQGCGYQLGGSRFSYAGKSEDDILSNSSVSLYYYDEGEKVGVIDPLVLMGDVRPSIGEYNTGNPLQNVGVFQSVYFTLVPEDIIKRVKNCNRPEEDGGPIDDLSIKDAEEILYQFKLAFEEAFTNGWNNETDGQIVFTGFWDDSGAVGTTGRMLEEITLSSGTLMTVSFIIIVVFSALFLFSFDVIESKVLLTVVGVLLVILSFFAALGVAILSGLKMNITVGWTLPFILIGLGVDDMYIVTIALKQRQSMDSESFVETMSSVLSPVTMTSLVVFAMFGVMNISDIPAVYVTARCGMISVAFLWLMIVTCFPAYCWWDILRQSADRCDVLFCLKRDVQDHSKNDAPENNEDSTLVERNVSSHGISGYVYNVVYKPLVVRDGWPRKLFGIFILAASLALLGVSIWGLAAKTSVGLGLEDFFPDDNQASVWARNSADYLASWSITMNWGAIDYTSPDIQQKMIKQFEDVVRSPHVSEAETKSLWMADFLVWSSKHCVENFAKRDPDQRECGSDQIYELDNSSCTGSWVRNTMGLQDKIFTIDGKDQCQPLEFGICRPASQMHYEDLAELQMAGLYDPSSDGPSASYCPIVSGWSNDKMKFCVERWRKHTRGGGDLVLIDDTDSENPQCEGEFLTDGQIESPIPISKGPIMFGRNLFKHEDVLDLIKETRAFCDEDPDVHCWMTGVPYDYWEQYLYVDTLLAEVGGYAVLAVFFVSFLFLCSKIAYERVHSKTETFFGSIVGSLIIASTGIISLVTVAGISSLAGVSLTSFSDMAFVLSVGYSTEYSVHIVHRWLRAPMDLSSSKDRVEYTMSFLFLPTFMSFVSSTIGVVCLAFTEFHFNEVYFFRPLIIVMFVTYFYGCYLLPFVLALLDFEFLKLGGSTTGDNQEQEGASDEVEVKGSQSAVEAEDPITDSKVEGKLEVEKDTAESTRDQHKAIEVATGVLPEPSYSDEERTRSQ